MDERISYTRSEKPVATVGDGFGKGFPNLAVTLDYYPKLESIVIEIIRGIPNSILVTRFYGGSTPVSALIHAATMVTAGVFMIARCSPLFEYPPTALIVITFAGAMTSFLAATTGILQNDLKRVIAYSTCSQLGYMIFACGISNYSVSAGIPNSILVTRCYGGSTPVSALIHAATMVTAGVFMIARCSPLFEYPPTALIVITFAGAMTSFLAATTGILQNDLKRVIAYSTCSQLGYMIFACGISNYSVSVFHLMNHAFFKALLFLSACLQQFNKYSRVYSVQSQVAVSAEGPVLDDLDTCRSLNGQIFKSQV
ncbi:hypothetical protein RD792_005545 [Penstemon davidsonii]|uniref:NADH:quinone oxidoreductase/Mrp antiporter transmembrane domain-containing protein n=1 Tax=Penstemon davidsonii TaxID=160366 RepID=A0ABR0DFT3_9LAMI|nr:hypothetical protein RD792_005545 [Penstemon davidsonii]